MRSGGEWRATAGSHENAGAEPGSVAMSEPRNARIRHAWLLAMLAALSALALGLTRLDQPNLWIDEIYTARWTRLPLAGVIAALKSDLHPPLFFLIEREVVRHLGVGEWGLRAFPVAMGAMAVFATFWAFCPALGARAALAASWVLALMPDFGLYARMARYYSLAVLLAMISHGLFVRAAGGVPNGAGTRQGSAAPAGGGERGAIARPGPHAAHWPLYALVVAAILYTSYAAACLPLAHGLMLAIRRDRAALSRWALAMAAAALLFAPWAGVLAHQLRTASQLLLSVVPGALRLVLMPAYVLIALSSSELVMPWTVPGAIGLVAGFAALMLGARAIRERGTGRALTGAALAAGAIGFTLLALLTRATPFIAAPARLLFLWPFAAALIGAALTTRPNAARLTLAFALAAAWAVGWMHLYAARGFMNPIYLTPAREAARDIARAWRPGDLVLAEDDSGIPWYLERMGYRGVVLDPVDPLTAARALEGEAARRLQSASGSSAPAADAARPRPARVIWARLSRDGSARIRPVAPTRALLAAWGRPIVTDRYLPIDPTLIALKTRLLGHPVDSDRLIVQWYDSEP